MEAWDFAVLSSLTASLEARDFAVLSSPTASEQALTHCLYMYCNFTALFTAVSACVGEWGVGVELRLLVDDKSQ